MRLSDLHSNCLLSHIATAFSNKPLSKAIFFFKLMYFASDLVAHDSMSSNNRRYLNPRLQISVDCEKRLLVVLCQKTSTNNQAATFQRRDFCQEFHPLAMIMSHA